MHYIHDINPIAFSFAGIAFSWYWLSYLLGLILCIFLGARLVGKQQNPLTTYQYWQHLQWSWPALFIGARLFYVFFYHWSFFKQHPQLIPAIWLGGMSFHGGLLGIIITAYFISRKQKSSLFYFTDIIATIAPLALMFGRIANFINGELAGRVSDLPWAVVFPRLYDELPRHPSQLYQALSEGLLLFIILMVTQKKFLKYPGMQSAFFLIGYGFFRFITEFFRLADEQLGRFWGLSLGQYLCLVMIFIGLLIIYSKKSRSKKILTNDP